jgi:hypothetical protein
MRYAGQLSAGKQKGGGTADDDELGRLPGSQGADRRVVMRADEARRHRGHRHIIQSRPQAQSHGKIRAARKRYQPRRENRDARQDKQRW